MTATSSSWRECHGHGQTRSVDLASPPGRALRQLALVTCDLGLWLTLFVAPLWMGGRQAPGRFVYLIAVGLSLSGWIAAQAAGRGSRWRWSGSEWLIAAATLWLAVQLTPLPPTWVQFASPIVAERLSLWSGSEPLLGPWRTISLTPEETRTCLMVFLAHVCLFLAVLQRLDTLRDVRRLLAWIAIAAVLLASLGLAQHLWGNGRFLWLYEHPSRVADDVVKGPFANQNHLAHFLALGMGPLAFTLTHLVRRPAPKWMRRGSTWLPIAFWSTGAALVAVATILTLSRGGWVAASVTLVAVACGFWMLRWWSNRVLAVVAVAALAVVGGAAALGWEPLAHRIASLQQLSSLAEVSARRQALWTAHLSTLPQVWLVGAGAGSHRFLYPTYMRNTFGVDFSHAENSYLQILLETGLPGIALLAVGWWFVWRWSWRAMRQDNPAPLRAAAMAAVSPLAASVIHSCCDFVWYIPSCMSLTVMCAAMTCRLSQLAASPTVATDSMSRPVAGAGNGKWQIGLACCMLLFAAFVGQAWGPARASSHWDRYWLSAKANRLEVAGDASLTPNALDGLVAHLESSLRWDPHQARAHSRLAALKLRQFDVAQMQSETPLPLSQIREAALSSGFASAQECRQWLARAVGNNLQILLEARRHARQAARLCPLQGEAYVFLSEVLFLEDVQPRAAEPFLQQALNVRPHQASVLLAVGGMEVSQGRLESGLSYWREAFHRDAAVQQKLIAAMGPQFTAQQFIEQFRPDLEALERIYWHYHNAGRAEQASVAGELFSRALREQAEAASGRQASELWLRASAIDARLGHFDRALDDNRRAVQCSPQMFEARRQLARRLSDMEQWDEAIAHWKWCLSRRPNDGAAQDLLRTARRQSLKPLH